MSAWAEVGPLLSLPLQGLRERYLERFSTLFSAMEKNGIGHTGKAFAVKQAK